MLCYVGLRWDVDDCDLDDGQTDTLWHHEWDGVETDRQVDDQVGAVEQQHTTTQSISRSWRITSSSSRSSSSIRRRAATSTCPSSTDESYQSWHHNEWYTLSLYLYEYERAVTVGLHSRCIHCYLPGVPVASQSAPPPPPYSFA